MKIYINNIKKYMKKEKIDCKLNEVCAKINDNGCI